MALAVEVQDVEKDFGTEVRALDGVTFGVEAGTVFGLLGPNGAGKTTLVRILATIIAPDEASPGCSDTTWSPSPRSYAG